MPLGRVSCACSARRSAARASLLRGFRLLPAPTPTHLTTTPLRTHSAVGCIMAELLQRKPLFPGKDYIDQLKLIIRTLVRCGWLRALAGWGC